MTTRAESRERYRRELSAAARACQAQLAAAVAAAGPAYEKTFRALVRAGQSYDRYRSADDDAFDDLLGEAAEPEAVANAVDIARASIALGALVELGNARPRRGAFSLPPPPSAKRGPLELTGPNLYAVAKSLPATARFHRQTFLGPLLERFGTTPQRARARLLELHREGAITLSRADLVEAMPAELVSSSALEAGGYTFHLLDPEGW